MKSAAFLSCVLMLGIFLLPNFVAGQEAAGSVSVEVTGIGKDADSSLRNALYQAVEQAVGAYVDNETVIKNEEVIHEKLLSVAQGFVEKYEVIQPPRERSDGSGVWETKVSASVKRSEVGAALRAAGVMQVAADGTAAWAEQITRLKSREDAMELLEKLIPEIPRNLFVCRLAEKTGELRTMEDPQSGDLLSLVDIEVSVNSDWWQHEALPALNAAFNVLNLRDFEPEVHQFTLQALPEFRRSHLGEIHSPSQEWSNTDGRAVTAAVAALSGTEVRFVMPDGRVTVYPLEKLSAESRDRLAKLTPSLSLPYKLREVRREEDDGNSWQIGEAVSFVENFKFIVMQGEYFFRDLSESFSRSSIKGKLRATHSIAGFQSDSQVAFHQFKVPEEYAERLDGVFIKGSEGGLPIPLSNSEFFNLCFVNFVNGDNEIVHHGKFFSPCWGSIPSHGGYGTIRFAPWLLSGEDEDQPSYYAGGPICTTRMIFSLAYSVPSETLREVKHIRLEPARYGVIDPVSD